MRREDRKDKGVDPRKEFLIKRYKHGRVLNVGCGRLYIDGAVNFDIRPDIKTDVIGDFHHLPFKNESFDTIFAFDIIEHTKAPEVLLNELLRVKHKNGNIIIECLDFDLCPQNWKNDSTHKTYFNKEIFTNFLSKKGFSCFDFGKEMLIAIKKPKLFDKFLCFVYRNLKSLKYLIVFGGR